MKKDAEAPRFGAVLAAGFATQVFASSSLNVSPIFAPVVAPAIGVPVHWVSIYYVVVSSVAMLAGLMSHVVIERQGALRATQLGLLAMALGVATAAGGASLMLVSALLVGLGYSAIGPASALLIARASPPGHVGFALSLKQAGAPVGIALTGALIPAGMLAFGWQATALAYASVGVLVALCVQPLRRALDRDRGARSAIAWRSALVPLKVVLGHPTLRALAIAAFGLSTIQTALIVYSVSYLHFDRGTTLIAAGFAYSAAQVLSLPGRVFWGWLGDRSGDPLGVLYGVAAGTIAFCLVLGLYPAIWPAWPAAIVLAVFGMVGASWNGVNLATVAKHAPPDQFAQAYAGILFTMFIGGVVGSFVFGVVIDIVGNYAAVFTASALIGVGVVVVLHGYRQRTR